MDRGYFAGMDCTCMAYSSSECCCDADWTDGEVYLYKNRLLNAFQLIKNGIKISHMKFDEFEKAMDNEYDCNGIRK
jgi:hypothetical protein